MQSAFNLLVIRKGNNVRNREEYKLIPNTNFTLIASSVFVVIICFNVKVNFISNVMLFVQIKNLTLRIFKYFLNIKNFKYF